jgi:type III pantothenate kinase
MFDPASPLIAVDIGNSRIKLGLFDEPTSDGALPAPRRVLDLPSSELDAARLKAWLPNEPVWPQWRIASVNRPATERLLHWIDAECRTPASTPAATRLLTHADFPIRVTIEHPERVGADRLAAAAAANRLRAADRATIVVDFGSAITVDLVSADGAFCGGAILPGIDTAARALNEFTDLLPLVTLSQLSEPPPALGVSTVSAIRGGLYWGAIGAVRELVTRLEADLVRPTELFLTGGAAAHLAAHLGRAAHHEPHLVLSGIAIAEV